MERCSTEGFPTISAVVVTYNRLSLLKESLAAIRGQTMPVSRLVVVNNGSTDDTRAWLDSQEGLVVFHQENLGGAGGFHRGVKEAAAIGGDAVWLMDDDVIPEPEALEKLCRAWRQAPEAGFLASRVVGLDGLPLNLPSLDRRPLENGSPAWAERAAEGLLTVKSATFVSILIPMVWVSRLGCPIAEMFIWGDDVEYTRRISRNAKGYWVMNSTVLHKRANQKDLGIVGEQNAARIPMFYYLFRNNLFIALRYRDYEMLARHLLRAAQALAMSVASPHGMTKCRVILKGLFNGLFFRPH